MSNILVIGKDLPDGIDFAESLASTGRKVFAISKSANDATKFESENIFTSTWNKSSAVSTHSTLIQAETKLSPMDEVVFYFDAAYFSSIFELDKTEEVSNAVDTMINSFLYSTNELIKRLDQLKEKTLVSFIVKEYPSKAEMLSSKITGMLPACNVVSAALQSFISLAESFASNVNDREYLSVILAKCNNTNELYKNDKGIASWLAENMNILEAQKNPQNVKHALNWNKVGTKIQTGFSLFK